MRRHFSQNPDKHPLSLALKRTTHYRVGDGPFPIQVYGPKIATYATNHRSNPCLAKPLRRRNSQAAYALHDTGKANGKSI